MVKGEKSEGEQKTCILSLGKKKKETVNTEPSVWSSEEAILQYCLKNCLQRQISILPKHCTTNHIYTLHNKDLQQKRKTIYKINEYFKKWHVFCETLQFAQIKQKKNERILHTMVCSEARPQPNIVQYLHQSVLVVLQDLQLLATL